MSAWRKRGERRQHVGMHEHPRAHAPGCPCTVCTGKARCFTAADWVGSLILCPHCNQVLKVTEAKGPYEGVNPNPEFGPTSVHVNVDSGAPDRNADRYWVLRLEDGYHARMWEHRKVVLL